MNNDAIKDLLRCGAALDSAVATISEALSAPNETDCYDVVGIEYQQLADSPGVLVRLHGLVLLTTYEQLKDATAQVPTLLARLAFSVHDTGGHPGHPVLTVLVTQEGDFCIDDATTFDDNMRPARRDQSRYRLSCALGQAVQGRLNTL